MNPAEHAARMDAERRQVLLGSDVDRTEAAIMADLAAQGDGFTGAWLLGESVVAGEPALGEVPA